MVLPLLVLPYLLREMPGVLLRPRQGWISWAANRPPERWHDARLRLPKSFVDRSVRIREDCRPVNGVITLPSMAGAAFRGHPAWMSCAPMRTWPTLHPVQLLAIRAEYCLAPTRPQGSKPEVRSFFTKLKKSRTVTKFQKIPLCARTQISLPERPLRLKKDFRFQLRW